MTTATPTCHWRVSVTGLDGIEHIIGEFDNQDQADALADGWGAADGVEVEVFPIDPPLTAEGWFTAEIV